MLESETKEGFSKNTIENPSANGNVMNELAFSYIDVQSNYFLLLG